MTDFSNIYIENNAVDLLLMKNSQAFISINSLLRDREQSPPVFKAEDLLAIQKNFHDLMHYRCRNSSGSLKWLADSEKELPIISADLIKESEPNWFSVSGMYGGFCYGLLSRNGKPVLITDSWVRIVGGSGEQHEITPEKVELVARGFV